MEIYQVIHEYDEAGGFGDAVPEEKVVAVFAKEEDAHAFVEKYAKPHAYEKPYSYLWCGELSVRVMEISNSLEEFETENGTNFWWLTNNVLEVTKEDDEEE